MDWLARQKEARILRYQGERLMRVYKLGPLGKHLLELAQYFEEIECASDDPYFKAVLEGMLDTNGSEYDEW